MPNIGIFRPFFKAYWLEESFKENKIDRKIKYQCHLNEAKQILFRKKSYHRIQKRRTKNICKLRHTWRRSINGFFHSMDYLESILLFSKRPFLKCKGNNSNQLTFGGYTELTLSINHCKANSYPFNPSPKILPTDFPETCDSLRKSSLA